jgi:hypothetical protein
MFLAALSLLVGCGAGSKPNTETNLTIVSQSPPDGVIGVVYGGTQGFSFAGSGGVLPYAWNWTSATGSSLPPGLSLSPQTGEVSGTPTTEGVYLISITIRDSSSPTNQVSLSSSITVTSPTPFAITSPNPPDATLGAPYGGDSGYALSASGGVAPYTWTWAAEEGSSLPPGLSLSSTGVISGTPTTTGSYTFSVSASDSEVEPAHAMLTYTISANQAIGLSITSGSPPSGRVGVSYGGIHLVMGRYRIYAFPLSATGGVPPYSWHWAAGPGSSLPPGLEVGVFSVGGGNRCCLRFPVIKGTPKTSGNYDVVLTATDSASPSAETNATYTINIQP